MNPTLIMLVNYANAALLTRLNEGPCARYDTARHPWLEPIIESLADGGVVRYATRECGVFTDLEITNRGIAELPWLACWT